MSRVNAAPRRLLAVLAAALTVAGCDLVTKAAAVRILDPGLGFSFLGDVLRVELVRNRGAFLGLGSGWSAELREALFIGSAIALVAGLAVIALRGSASAKTLWSLALVAGGGIGNGLDRALHGEVVDFLNLGVGALRTGVFNAADLAITAGCVLLLWPRRSSSRCETDPRES